VGPDGPSIAAPDSSRAEEPALASPVPSSKPAEQSRETSDKPSGTKHRTAIPLLLLAVSVVTTTANGARFMQNFLDGMPPVVQDSDLWPWPWLMAHPEAWVLGLAFSVTMLGILLIHEYGHYFACKAHGIRASLPWVLPAPTLSGTMGAVIRIRSRMPSRNAVMDVGIYGPLAGYVASVIAVAVGFALSYHAPANPAHAIVRFGGEPLTIRFLHHLLVQWDPTIPSFNNIAPHPVLVAGWIGLFITSLNLIPGGQFDGGHVLYAISPRMNRWATKALPLVLFVAGMVCWVGWMLWGAFMLIPAMRHPEIRNPQPLSRGRVVLGAMGLGIFLLTFTPWPFDHGSLMEVLLHVDPLAGLTQ
jgi:Zn-dependent protease